MLSYSGLRIESRQSRLPHWSRRLVMMQSRRPSGSELISSHLKRSLWAVSSVVYHQHRSLRYRLLVPFSLVEPACWFLVGCLRMKSLSYVELDLPLRLHRSHRTLRTCRGGCSNPETRMCFPRSRRHRRIPPHYILRIRQIRCQSRRTYYRLTIHHSWPHPQRRRICYGSTSLFYAQL